MLTKRNIIMFFILIVVIAATVVSCGNEEGAPAAGPEEKEFRAKFRERLNLTIKEMEKADQAMKTIFESAISTHPKGDPSPSRALGAETPMLGDNEGALGTLTLAETRLMALTDQPPLYAPAECPDCSSDLETLEKNISRCLTEIANVKQSFSLGQQTLKIRSEQLQKLEQQLPKVTDDTSYEEFIEEYNIKARIYGETLLQWQALTVTGESIEPMQKVLLESQKLIDLNHDLAAAGLSTSNAVEMDRADSVFGAEIREGEAVGDLYDSTTIIIDKRTKEVGAILRELSFLSAG